MTRLPLRPFGNKPTSDKTKKSPQPALGAGSEVFADSKVSPQLASTEPAEGISAAPKQNPVAAPAPPELTSFTPKVASGKTPVRPSKPLPEVQPVPVAPEPVRASEDRTEAPNVSESAMPAQPHTPTINNLSASREQILQDKLEEQRLREQAINRLPESLKKSIHRLFEHLTSDDSSEVVLNGPKTIGFKSKGQRFIDRDIDFLDTETYHAVINDFLLPLTNTSKRIGTDPHRIEGKLSIPDPSNPSRPPMHARVHIIAPPTVENAVITIAKKSRNQLTVDAMVASGTMTSDMGQLLKDLARGRATIVLSGVSGAGKTTVLEALSREFDVNDRIILIEDTEELTFASQQTVPLLSHQALPDEDPARTVSLEWLVRQANRMRPDRIIVGEVRGAEMAEFLIAANSGADGSMTTVHANNPQEAIHKMLSLSSKDASSKSETSILQDIASTVQVIVQLSIIDGRHVVSQIEEVSDTINRTTMGVQTQTIYRFDRNTGRFNFENRISDEFNQFLKQRGVEVQNPTNFMNRY